jgi:hypothetical protein
MKGMKWVLALNAALAGIVILVGSVFAYSLIRGATRPTPAAPAVVVDKKPDFQKFLPLEVPPVCIQVFDQQKGQLLMQVKNVSDQPLSYSSRGSSGDAVEMYYFVNGTWGVYGMGFRCGCGSEYERMNRFVIEAGQTKVFRAYVLGKMFPVRYTLRLVSPDGRMSEIPIGEYRPPTCFSQASTQ